MGSSSGESLISNNQKLFSKYYKTLYGMISKIKNRQK